MAAGAGSARGSCSQTDWRCPAGRLRESPRHGHPAPLRPARGRERPHPLARALALRGRGASGREIGWGRLPRILRHPHGEERRYGFPPSPPGPSRVFCFVAGFREGDRARGCASARSLYRVMSR